MQRVRFKNWLKNIYNTQDEELSCTQCFDLVSRYVELEVSGGNAMMKMPQVQQHLDQCKACRDEYEMLLDLTRFENDGRMPPMDSLKDSIR